jgi:hypothetical protein
VGFGLSVPRSILTLNALLGLGHGAASGVRGDLRRSRFLVCGTSNDPLDDSRAARSPELVALHRSRA